MSGCYLADLRVEYRFWGYYPAKVPDNTPEPGVIQCLPMSPPPRLLDQVMEAIRLKTIYIHVLNRGGRGVRSPLDIG
ncbi:MAG: hypothetical protein DCF17_07655 [Shackletoniella antarctica]|uniref:Uncharacterized protein n=1 Tax=Shackletoniella antarctica TaxID=268115 RepID=A0A2W4WCN5_9CYAN|nr:MAG: hypothetical protein DCF17_07655 [Shackletoniella antarctica]